MKREKETKNDLSRRDFIKTTAVGVGATALAGLSSAEAKAAPLPQKWDKEADVVVAGYGLGGMCAAIEAHDAGAKVLILEKAPKGREGGTCRASGQFLLAPPPELEEAMYEYLRNQDYRHVIDEDVHRAVAAELVKVEPWILSLGGETYPALVGGSPYPAVWNVPGKEACVRKFVNSPTSGNAIGWSFFDSVVKSQGIEILYSTPAKSLVATAEGEVLGVKVESEGWDKYIKARRGVVLATGGFEANQEMLKGYALSPMYYHGCPYDTGDGYIMAQALGAEFLAMDNILAPTGPCLKVPDFEASFQIAFPANSVIYVNKFGQRFINEFKPNTYGYDWHDILLFSKEKMTFPQAPWYAIFDQIVMDAGPICSGTSGWNLIVEGYKWSSNNQTELAKGWIQQANTLDAVATAIAQLPSNEGKMQSSTLSTTVQAYNTACANKNDPQFGRPADRLVPISGPPYYFMELWPRLHAMQGGPKRDAKARIINVRGKVIPRLYSVGEMGSWWGSGYDGGFCEGVPSGRIAGRNAAAETPWS
ncbi:MAG: FAD-binding protein [Acidobacteria bacterium]|nr:FAD-binding protein [Acidobacteriota bacterium]